MARLNSQLRGTSEKAHGTAWVAGTRRIGGDLEVRDRWQGLVGPNAWLTILLAAGAIGSALVTVEVRSSDRLGPALGALFFAAALLLMVLRFHPVVRLGPETIRWRNRFALKALPTNSVQRLGIESVNVRSWVPVVVAYTDRKGLRRHKAKLYATFSYRRRVAVVIATQVRTWADEHAIPADLDPASMVWQFKAPNWNPPSHG